MLARLDIRDFVIVDRTTVEFDAGFTVLTGETGAGKSILIDALSFVLGERGDAGVVRSGAKQAEVSAQFVAHDAAGLAAWLEENGFEADSEGLLLRRLIDSAGRSRGFVNGSPCTIAQLRQAGALLVDIHGQHAHQSLLRSAEQRDLLDAFGGCADLAAQTREAFVTWRDCRERVAEALQHAEGAQREREMVEWQLRELDALAFRRDEWESTQLEHRRLEHASALIEAAQSALESLSEAEPAALSLIGAAQVKLERLREHDPGLDEILQALEPARIQLEEAIRALRHYQSRVELDPTRLAELERRIDAVMATARKYRVAPEALDQLHERARARLSELAASLDVDALRAAEAAAQAGYRDVASRLGAARKKAAARLGREVTAAIQRLALAGGRFEVALTPALEGGAHGLEQVEFRVSSHAALAPGPLAKVASGGELSRVSLAIQTALSRVAKVPTLIFDEVDAGIGGAVAAVVGSMLRELGGRHQVMCVTHLAQVAACAGTHMAVAKQTEDERPTSRVARLDRAARVRELARMQGGASVTTTALRHAEELLDGGQRREG